MVKKRTNLSQMTNVTEVKVKTQGSQTIGSIPDENIFSDIDDMDVVMYGGWRVPEVAVGVPRPVSPIGMLTNQDPEDWDLGSGLET